MLIDVLTGTDNMGLRWASHGVWRVVAYAQGGYSVNHHVKGIGWCLAGPGVDIPAEIEGMLCRALSIEMEGGF